MMVRLFLLSLLLSIISGCSQIRRPSLNEPLDASASTTTLPLERVRNTARSDELTLVLTFSGGGTRAAAFSYGVLQELQNTPMPRSSRLVSLLDEVDLISSVSGGSFTAAYYGLYGKRIFTDYESRFLKRPVQTSLIKHLLLSPSNWIRLAPDLYNRSDLAADYYERTIFGKKRFVDLRKDGPHIVINTTDLATGRAFSFFEPHFRSICSKLETYPVGRAVVASSAVPVVFSPIAIKNYSDQCAVHFAKSDYKNHVYKPYLQLVDGGVVDNLGIRSLLTVVSSYQNNFWKLMKAYQMTNNRKVAFIVVDASDAISPSIGQNQRSPDTATILGAVATIQSSRFNQETLNLLKGRFDVWKSQVVKGRCAELPSPSCGDIEFYMAELNFNQLPASLANELSLVETSLELPPELIDKLIHAGRVLLKQSPDIERLLNNL